MSRRTVWILNHYAISPDQPGGTRHYDLARELVTRGYRVVIIAAGFHYSLLKETKNYDGSHFVCENVDGVEFVWLETTPYTGNDWKRAVNMLSYAGRALRIGKGISPKPDLIIGSSVHLFAAFSAYRLARHYRVPFLLEIRDIWPLTLIHMGMPRWHPFVVVLGVLERLLYRKAARIITLLPHSRPYFEGRGVPAERISVIPNGVDMTRYSGPGRVESAASTFTVMYLGKHGRSDSLKMLLDAADHVQKCHYEHIRFVLVGDGAEKEALVKYAEGLGLRNVEFRPSVKKCMVPEVLSEADAVVSLMQDVGIYRYGVSENKECDYAAAGKPVVLVGKPADSIVAQSGCGIVIAPNDREALCEAIVSLQRMSVEERARMGEKGREYVRRLYAIPMLASRLEGLVEEVLQ